MASFSALKAVHSQYLAKAKAPAKPSTVVTPPPSASSVTRSATAFTRARRYSSSLSSMHGRQISAGNEIFRALLGG